MARYFFHMRDGETILDREGIELANLDAVREEALRACGEMLRDIPEAIHNGEPFRLWVTDKPCGRGHTLFAVTVATKSGRLPEG
jgi:hypothetical protein